MRATRKASTTSAAATSDERTADSTFHRVRRSAYQHRQVILLAIILFGCPALTANAIALDPASEPPQPKTSEETKPEAPKTPEEAKPEAPKTPEEAKPEAPKTPEEAKPEAPSTKPKTESTEQKRLPIFQWTGRSLLLSQQLFSFHSPYRGPNSLTPHPSNTIWTYSTLYLGARIAPRWELYVNPEVTGGGIVGREHGLGGYVNFLANQPGPYFSRAFVRWTVPVESPRLIKIEKDDNVIPGSVPERRLVISAGKASGPDFFDHNVYANNPYDNFSTSSLNDFSSWDYAQDFRGYTRGIVVEYIQSDWAARIGSFQMPFEAGGGALDWNMLRRRGDHLELEFHPRPLGKSQKPGSIRLLTYRNVAKMGRYEDALRQSRRTGEPPSTVTVRRSGDVKWGTGLNFDLPIADGGDTGIFGRWGWNDGQTETFMYDEVDRTLSLGAQISGKRWDAPRDRLGVALVQNEISSPHRRYLAAGGLGFRLGDGRLNYHPERLLEIYYQHGFSSGWNVSLIYQGIVNPGYNSDRGPVSVLSLRVNRRF